MAFQILGREGQPIPIFDLDKEAAEFWGVAVSPKTYANPAGDPYQQIGGLNWYDTIGWAIHCHKATTWEMVIGYFIDMDAMQIATIWEPHAALIKYWYSKGYVPCYKE